MTKAFVFGKFLPFHKGHEALIKFALTKCDFLTVLICCSDQENIAGYTRASWIEKTFKNENRIDVKIFNYFESELPNTSVSSKYVSLQWANIFKTLLPYDSIVITSEVYGEYVAGFMNIRHIPFDISRTVVPVSATIIRRDLFANWHFLPESVKPYFALKVVILGTESTGKTTLAKKLSQYYNCGLVLEAGRDLIPNSNIFSYRDLTLVAEEHAKRISNAILGSSPLIIIDTDIHTTISYGRFAFGKDLEVNPKIYNLNRAALYLYLNDDAEYIQDGTRFDEVERNRLDNSHRQVLQDYNINFIEITGSWEARFEIAVQHIDKLIQ